MSILCMTLYLQIMGHMNACQIVDTVAASDVIASPCALQANAPAALYWLRRVLDNDEFIMQGVSGTEPAMHQFFVACHSSLVSFVSFRRDLGRGLSPPPTLNRGQYFIRNGISIIIYRDT